MQFLAEAEKFAKIHDQRTPFLRIYIIFFARHNKTFADMHTNNPSFNGNQMIPEHQMDESDLHVLQVEPDIQQL
jgi:hypothetical protein